MTTFIHSLIEKTAQLTPEKTALVFKDVELSYAELAQNIATVSQSLSNVGLLRHERVAIYAPKTLETVSSIFGTAKAGGVFVPVNPLLKAPQVRYILDDCNVRVLITQSLRLNQLQDEISQCPDLHTIITLDKSPIDRIGHVQVIEWSEFLNLSNGHSKITTPMTDSDMAAILYTSGSTGNPKGVILSHRNMVVGAESVSSYLENNADDRILAVLPFSFDYGLSQLTTAFSVGASVYLMDYLLPNDILKAITKYNITGLAAVPPLWAQLCKLEWKNNEGSGLRYFTNSGGAMPEATLRRLREAFPNASPYLMYGLTEAFRSTYLPPTEVDKRPTSMGKAIPNADIRVVREDGSECASREPGELVHSGPLVSLGYWNSIDKTNERFKKAPGLAPEITNPALAVWSGDTVFRDEEGFLYFVGRKDDMIKTSGYRVSPTEIEETIYASGMVTEAAALGIPHPDIGQAIVIFATRSKGYIGDGNEIIKRCIKDLPNFMVPKKICFFDALPHNANGKIDRKALLLDNNDLFTVN